MNRRIQLTSVTPADAPSVNRWKNDPEIQALSSDSLRVEPLEETEARVLSWQASDPNQMVHFAIRSLPRNELLGFCHLAEIDVENRRCKLGIVIGERTSWGQGLGREALALMIEEAYARGLSRLVAEVYADNERSVRLFEGSGFSLEATLRAAVLRDGRWVDELVYGLQNAERTQS